MDYVKILPSGKAQVDKSVAFCELLHNKLPAPKKPIDGLLDEFDIELRKIDNSITREALSNVHGDWYEWLLAISSWNYICENRDANLLVLLPNVTQFDVSSLYVKKLYNLILDLKQKVMDSSSVQLITSNPDFVMINRKLVEKIEFKLKRIEKVTPENLIMLGKIFQDFTNTCEFEDIIGYISVKTSLRPDRRLQIPHEGSLMKALYTHLQTREWITNPKGLKYYAITTKLTNPDRKALKTVATHSLTTVFTLPQAAVDDVFEINSLQQAHSVWKQVLG